MPGQVILTEPVAKPAANAGIAVEELVVRMMRGVDDPLACALSFGVPLADCSNDAREVIEGVLARIIFGKGGRAVPREEVRDRMNRAHLS